MGADGEAAALFSEIVLCENPSRPVQFAISAQVRYPIESLLSRAPYEIFGKLSERIVLALGLHELRMRPDPACAFASYKILIDEILSKTASVLYLLTIPAQAFPECASEVEAFNLQVRGMDDGDRVHVMDFAKHVDSFEKDQILRGKFARSLYDSTDRPTSLCHTLLGLFLSRRIFNTKKEDENGLQR